MGQGVCLHERWGKGPQPGNTLPQPCQVGGGGGGQKPQLGQAVGEGRAILPGQMSAFALLAPVLAEPAQWL